MVRINPIQVTPQLESLFDADMPAGLRCFAVLDGDVKGRIFTDNPADPQWGIVQEPGDGTVYVGGSIDTRTLHQCLTELRRDGDVIVGAWRGDPLIDLLPESPAYNGAAIDFTDRFSGVRLDAFVEKVPEGCELRRVDHALFDRLAERDQNINGYGSAEEALEKGLGFCLMQGEAIVCESFAGPVTRGVREIGVRTDEQCRGRGYATITCARLIQACEAMGWRTYWNTAQQNLASVALARKFGYRTEREYRVLAWFKTG
jgi:RimJ/RimL family protein N-acetyltransferase